MAGLMVSKNVILPKLDNIKDPETKRVMQGLYKTIQGMNTTYYNDLIYLEERVYDLEHP